MRMKYKRTYELLPEKRRSNPNEYKNGASETTNEDDTCEVSTAFDITDLRLKDGIEVSEGNVNSTTNPQDHQKPSKRKANTIEQRSSEEKAPKVPKRNVTPESLPSGQVSNPATPPQANNYVDDFLRRSRPSVCNVPKSDYFEMLPDEVVLMIFKEFSKTTLVRCAGVCRRWRNIAYDNDLWVRIELSRRKIPPGSMAYVLTRTPIVLRMSQTEVCTPIFENVEHTMENFVSRLEYLDLSMAIIQPKDLQLLLRSCHTLLKLSLENCALNENVCQEIAKNTKLTVINMSQCTGLNDVALKMILVSCKKLVELNLAWTGLKAAAIKCVCQFVSKEISRINLSGCINEVNDSHVSALVIRCNKLIELDLSDASNISVLSLQAICDNLKSLRALSLSRCYNIYPSNYSKLFQLPSLKYLNIFGLFPESRIESFRKLCTLNINQMKFSFVARPTVGDRRTSIWGM